MTNSKKAVKTVKKEKEPTIFEKEIMRLPQDMKDKLLKHQGKIQEIVDIINKKNKKQSIGVYVTPEVKIVNKMPVPNFDNLTINFLFDDYENPIPQFNAKVFFEKEFDKILVEEIKKDEQGQEYASYHFKKDKNMKFVGTSIAILRENCFDAIYDDLKTLGSSFVYEDNRGFISALKSIDIHRNMLLQKFEKYVVVMQVLEVGYVVKNRMILIFL